MRNTQKSINVYLGLFIFLKNVLVIQGLVPVTYTILEIDNL